MLDHPPLSASPDLDAGIATRLDQVVELARAQLGDSLQTVLLGGSLARGEAFGVDDAGTLRLLSDLDLYFVVTPGSSAAELPEKIRAWASVDSFLVAPPDVAVVGPEYFFEARESMPMPLKVGIRNRRPVPTPRAARWQPHARPLGRPTERK